MPFFHCRNGKAVLLRSSPPWLCPWARHEICTHPDIHFFPCWFCGSGVLPQTKEKISPTSDAGHQPQIHKILQSGNELRIEGID